MDSKFANYHDPLFSVIQSAVNEHINKEKKGGRKGLNYREVKMQTLYQSLNDSRNLGPSPAAKMAVVPDEVAAPHMGILQRIIAFFIGLFKGKEAKDTSDYTVFRILEEYASAKMKGDEQLAEAKVQELKFSGYDPAWVNSMLEWFDYYMAKMKNPMYIRYKSIDDFAYTLPPLAGKTLRIGLVADWGTGEEMAETVLDQIFLTKPDVIIHLGDIYYSGTEEEYQNHFIDIVTSLRKKHNLPVPVYNLTGNHDYYSGGHGFYGALKLLNKGLNTPEQEASYFTLSNDHWQIQAMDTGYHDNDVLHVNDDMTHLEDTEVKWHQHHIEKGIQQKKRIILLSHHQLFSRYEAIGGKSSNPNLLNYFGKYINNKQIAAWFWGHEHLMEVYKPFLGLDKGRCIGNSAVPIFWNNCKAYHSCAEWKGKPVADLPEVSFTGFDFPNNGDVFDRGFAILELNDDQSGKAKYYTVNNNGKPFSPELIFEEDI